MKLTRGTTSVSDQTFSWVMRLGVMVLAIGIGTFGFMYFQDQHVDAGPSLVGRQIAGAEAAVAKAPNNVQTRLQLAAAYLLDKRPDDALKQYDEILTAEKGNRTALLGRGGVLVTKGELVAAAVTYHKVTDVAAKGEYAGADPQAQEAHYYLGSIALKQGKTKEAIKELQAALTINRADSDALYLLGVAQLKDGTPKLAVASLNEAVLFVPTGWCEPYTQLALAYGKLAQAPQKAYATAMGNFCLKKPADAKSQLKALAKGPVAVQALLGLAVIAETESNTAEAVTWYQKVLTIDRRNAGAISALSRLGAGPTSSPTTQGPTP